MWKKALQYLAAEDAAELQPHVVNLIDKFFPIFYVTSMESSNLYRSGARKARGLDNVFMVY